MGAQHCPLGLHALWGLRAARVAGGHPRGGRPTTVVRASGVRCCPSPSPPSSGAGSRRSAACMSRVRSVRACGPSTGRTACALAGRRCSLWGWRKGVLGGGAFHHSEGRLRSGAPPPPTARPPGGLLGYATQVLWARVCGCGGPALALWLTCPVGACAPRGRRGASGSGAPPSLLPALWAGCRGPLATCCACGCGCVRCVWCLCGACRGAWCCLSPVPLVPPSPVLRCGVVLAVCLPCPLPCARPLLGCWIPPVSFLASWLFTLSSTLRWLALLPGMHFFTASALVCVSVFFLACFLGPGSGPLLSLLLGPVRQGEDGGVWAFGRRLGTVAR